MAYEKTYWKDQSVENPRTYTFRDNGDGTYTLLDAFGKVTELGTPVNAENMNHIENGIANNETAITQEISERKQADTQLQTAVNAKQSTITGAASSITNSNLTASRALGSSSNGKVAATDITLAELGHLDGVKRNIQAQLNEKAPLASPAFTGTPTMPTAATNTKNNQAASTAFVYNRIINILSELYPVGSLFFSTASTCPLQSLGIGTWEKVGTSLTLSVNTTVPVAGTGVGLCLTNGTLYGSLIQSGPYGSAGHNPIVIGYANTPVGQIAQGPTVLGSPGQAIGITTDASMSGIVGTVTRTQITVNVFQRTA